MEREAESTVESHLVKEVKKLGGVAYKFTSPSRRSVPDRLVVIPLLPCRFVELKATGKRPTPAQEREIRRLRKLKQDVFVVDHRAKVDLLIDIWKEELDELRSNIRPDTRD